MEAPKILCSTCDMSFDKVEDMRQHAKSEWHIYKLRCKVAEPGTVIPPPINVDGQEVASACKDNKSATSSEYESDHGSTEDEEREALEFKPEQCLFCPSVSDTFESNASHMKSAHSLTIPYESSLSVEFVTLIWYLHLVIFSYHECIFCGTHRRTLEAVQQHMLGKGHCRFKMTDEMMEFYDLEASAEISMDGLVRVDEDSVRLPNGKVLSHRSQTASSAKPRVRSQKPSTSKQLPSAPPAPTGEASSNALIVQDLEDPILASQLARLSVNDQRSLAHLPIPQQRSLLVRRKKELDDARRAEKRAQRRVDRIPDNPNKTILKTNLLLVAMRG
ncbi:Fc.00g103000.m01.CDS01 [Cosmosporella sp. VM-42]